MFKKLVACILLMTIIAGCGACGSRQNTDVAEEVTKIEEFYGMCGKDYEIAYEMTTQYPGILINRAGYQSGAEKKALFLTEELSGTYYIKEKDTNEIVYQGTMEQTGFFLKSGKPVSQADFTEFDTPGEYYFENDILGQSYPFQISDTICSDQLVTIIQEYSNLSESFTEKPVIEIVSQMSYLLMSYELYSSQYKDGMLKEYEKNEIPDVLEIVKKYIEWLLNLQNMEFTPDEQACCAGLLANFSQIYNLYDNNLANKCKKLAEDWMKLLPSDALPDGGILYYANMMNYLSTGYSKYKTALEKYLQERESSKTTTGDSDYILMADLAYMTSKRSVKVEYCDMIMNYIMEQAETASAYAKENGLSLCGDSTEQILYQIKYIVIANYVLESKEYRRLLENQFAYFQGRNYQSVICPISAEEGTGAVYLLLLNEMMK